MVDIFAEAVETALHLVEQLKEIGVNAKIVSDGHAALALIRQHPFALVLMDCHMPGMSGYETTRRIRELEVGASHIPVIAISAATDSAHLSRCMDSGMDGVLKKPLRLDELHGMLKLWLGETTAFVDVDSHESVSPSLDLNMLYGETMKEDMASLRVAFSNDDHRLTVHLAHRIKGAALMAGASAMAEYAERLETTIASDRQDRETAIRALGELEIEIIRWLSRLSAEPDPPTSA